MSVVAAKTRGFTLLEMLIGMALLGLIMGLLFGGMRLASRSWDAGELRFGHATHLSSLQGFLRRELSQVYPYRWRKKIDTDVAFSGEATRLRFVAPIAAQLGPGGLHLLSLEQVSEGESGRLVLKSAIPDADSGDFTALDAAEKIVLADKVEALAFSYYGAESRDGEAHWSEKWTNPTLLPRLIRVDIKFSDGRSWANLLVSPQIAADVGDDPSCKFSIACVNGRPPR